MLRNALEVLEGIEDGHSLRVGRLVYALCREIGLNEEESRLFAQASRYHDIGKVAIPRFLLETVRPLTDEERRLIEKHVAYGLSLLSRYRGKEAEIARAIIATHHEHWDGSGYPKGLRGEEIPLCGRITAICDVYDALRSKRPYREAWPADRAEAYIRDRRGRQFDPGLVDPFLRVVTRVNHPMAKARGL